MDESDVKVLQFILILFAVTISISAPIHIYLFIKSRNKKIKEEENRACHWSWDVKAGETIVIQYPENIFDNSMHEVEVLGIEPLQAIKIKVLRTGEEKWTTIYGLKLISQRKTT